MPRLPVGSGHSSDLAGSSTESVPSAKVDFRSPRGSLGRHHHNRMPETPSTAELGVGARDVWANRETSSGYSKSVKNKQIGVPQ